MIDQLPMAKYRFRVRAKHDLLLPAYAGSLLRGVFGHALRKLSCMTQQPSCDGCPLTKTCPYTVVFLKPGKSHSLQKFSHMPNPYVIEPPKSGERWVSEGEYFEFSMVLMGQAIQQLPLIIMAWQKAFSRGIGSQRVSCELDAVYAEGEESPIFNWKTRNIVQHECREPDDVSFGSQVTLHFNTPLRLQKKGQLLTAETLSPEALLVSLARRYQLLCDEHLTEPSVQDFKQLKEVARTITMEKNLHWWDWTRYSNRQKQFMKLGGLLGTVSLEGDLEPFRELLKKGQWTHVGKNATFGLGDYHLIN